MINFIVCDDNKIIRNNVVEIINQVMMKNKLAYKTYPFDDFNSNFLKIIDQPMSCKIYILDIETPSRSGIDIARLIRKRDVNSVLIFLTSHDELGYTILKSQFLFLSFICKYDDYEKNLELSIKKALEVIGQKRVIQFEDHGVAYTIPINDILYVSRDTVERKCIIQTDYSEFKINRSLAQILKELGPSFKLSHRCCIVNMERIRVYNRKENTITFDNDMVTDLVSSSFKKEVKKDVVG